MPPYSDILAWGALLVSAATALNSLRKTNIDDRSGAVVELTKVIETYKGELARTQSDLERERRDHAATIARHERLIVEMTEKHERDTRALTDKCEEDVANLQRQTDQQQRTIMRQTGEITHLKEQLAVLQRQPRSRTRISDRETEG